MENKLNKKAPILPILKAKNESFDPFDPFILLFAGEYYFCIENSDWNLFLSEIKKMETRYNKPLNPSVYESCLAAYAKSFNDGYFSFVGRINTDEVFDLDNIQRAERIINRVKNPNILLYPLASYVCGDNGKKYYECSGMRSVDKFHKAGFDNGEYYKAVEIIKTNPNQFESFLTPQQNDETEPEINELKTDYLADNLTKLFDGFNKSKKRIDNDRKADFIKLFQDENLVDWKPIEWEGSNPELATLIFKLTGQSPVPLKVNRYFKTKYKYDTNNQSGKRKENAQIATIFNKTMGYNKLKKEA